MSTRIATAYFIYQREAQIDKAGNVIVYKLPANDGGGAYEVAGINEKYNPKEAAYLKELVEQKKYTMAQDYAVNFIASDTDSVSTIAKKLGTTLPAWLDAYLRDCIFNRGLTGATLILQRALNVDPDAVIGDQSRNSYKAFVACDACISTVIHEETGTMSNVRVPLLLLNRARREYEYHLFLSGGKGYRKNLDAGLDNRWDSVLLFSTNLS